MNKEAFDFCNSGVLRNAAATAFAVLQATLKGLALATSDGFGP